MATVGTDSWGRKAFDTMGSANRILGLVHIALAVAVAAEFLASPFLTGDIERNLWYGANWLIAAGALSALVISYIRWRASVNSDGREQLIATVMIVAAVLLVLVFFENWFSSSLFVGEDIPEDAYRAGALINPAFVMISTVVGLRLLRTDSGS